MSAVPKSSVQYQAMQESDLDAVMAIETRVYEFPWTRGNFLDSMRAGYSCWLCTNEYGLVGYAVLMNAADEVHLLNLSIAVEYQRQGQGARLLAFLIGNARAAGDARMILEVRPSNQAGRRLYANFNFRQVGERRDYYPAAKGRENALVLAFDL